MSEATVEWSGAKVGVPFGRKPILFYLTTVRAALRILGSEYDVLAANGETEAMCRKLAHHVTEMNAQWVRHDIEIERPMVRLLWAIKNAETWRGSSGSVIGQEEFYRDFTFFGIITTASTALLVLLITLARR